MLQPGYVIIRVEFFTGGKNMRIGLGIDTGGTFTDAALYDFVTKKILCSSKSPTTKNDLRIGIENALDQLDVQYMNDIKIVSLSTTLATNACVEDKGAKAVLILIGCHPKVLARYGHEYGLPAPSDIILLDGKIDDHGKIEMEPDWNELENKLQALGDKPDCYAVVQTWSMKNPTLELKTEEIITKKFQKPVVCGHELSGKLNVLKRAASALLNAKLIPVIRGFMDSVNTSLTARNINAPVVIVRGDGSIMSLDFALKRPVETLLSGPASSVHGGMLLSPHDNLIIVDIGGTTGDMAIIKDGYPGLIEDGAVVGNWKTAVSSIDIVTSGIGGDSEVIIDKNKGITTGTNRVIPLCTLSSTYKCVSVKLKEILSNKPKHTRPLPVFYVLTSGNIKNLNDYEMSIVNALKDGPVDILTLCDRIGVSIYAFRDTELEKRGIIAKSTLTPTDVMHIQKDFVKWDRDASLEAVQILSYQYDIPVNQICSGIYQAVIMKIYQSIVRMLLEKEQPDILTQGNIPLLNKLLDYSSKNNDLLSINFKTNLPICGLGAPAKIFIPKVAQLLNTTDIVPEYASVANAIGAVTGRIISIEEGIILPQYESHSLTGYMVRLRSGSTFFKKFEDALIFAENTVKETAMKNAIGRGAVDITTEIKIEENNAEIMPTDEEGDSSLFVDMKIIARATGRFNLAKE